MLLDKWDFRFLELAAHISEYSKDRTKIGAVIVRPDNTISSVGYNGLPPGIDDEAYLKDRNLKNSFILHAEENAILSAKDSSLEGFSIYAWGLHVCPHCTSQIIRKGIKKVYSVLACDSPDWSAPGILSNKLLEECGIDNHHYDISDYNKMRHEFNLKKDYYANTSKEV